MAETNMEYWASVKFSAMFLLVFLIVTSFKREDSKLHVHASILLMAKEGL